MLTRGGQGSVGAREWAFLRADAEQNLQRQGDSKRFGETPSRRNATTTYNAPEKRRPRCLPEVGLMHSGGLLGLTSIYSRVLEGIFHRMFPKQRGPYAHVQLMHVDTECTREHGRE